MSKIAITADNHLGVVGRLSDSFWACRVIREYCKRSNIDVVMVLGDLFHDRSSLGIDVLWHASQFFDETASKYDQKWIVFPGNHDMFLRNSWKINSLGALKKHLTVIDEIKLLTLNDRRFWILPFVQYEKSFMKVLKKLEERYETGDVLFTHIGVRGATLNTCFLLKDWSVVSFDWSKFQKIYTGHFHNKQQVGEKVFYPGSPIPFKFDEGDISHGFYVYDLETETHKFVNIWKAGEAFFPEEKAPPQFCTFLDELVDTKTVQDVSNNIIRVALHREYSLEEKRKIKDKLMGMGAICVRWMNLSQRLQKKEEVLITEHPHRNLFKTWLEMDAKNLEGLDISILYKAHDDVVQEGDELYAIEETEQQ